MVIISLEFNQHGGAKRTKKRGTVYNIMDKITNERLLEVPTHNCDDLSYGEIRFIDEFMATGDRVGSVMKAFPEITDKKKASGKASRLLRKSEVKSEIACRSRALSTSAIMDAQEIMELYTKIARGEVQDQFGLDASLKDRLAAMKDLYKMIDSIQTKAENKTDNKIEVHLIRD